MSIPSILHHYAEQAKSAAIYPEALTGSTPELMYLGLGLAGGAGELAGKISKFYRNQAPFTYLDRDIITSLGDVMWNWAMLCTALGLDPQAVLQENLNKLKDRQRRGKLGGSGDMR